MEEAAAPGPWGIKDALGKTSLLAAPSSHLLPGGRAGEAAPGQPARGTGPPRTGEDRGGPAPPRTAADFPPVLPEFLFLSLFYGSGPLGPGNREALRSEAAGVSTWNLLARAAPSPQPPLPWKRTGKGQAEGQPLPRPCHCWPDGSRAAELARSRHHRNPSGRRGTFNRPGAAEEARAQPGEQARPRPHEEAEGGRGSPGPGGPGRGRGVAG